MPQSNEDQRFMREALRWAGLAFRANEVPVGAVVVRSGEIIGRGRNHCQQRRDASAHAEMLALRQASRRMGDWRLEGCTLFCSLEPCPMCMGACLNARIERIVYATKEPKAGACGSLVDLRALPGFNHHIQVESGLMAEESAALLSSFFRNLRAAERQRRQR